jgi:hypothetical protein
MDSILKYLVFLLLLTTVIIGLMSLDLLFTCYLLLLSRLQFYASATNNEEAASRAAAANADSGAPTMYHPL